MGKEEATDNLTFGELLKQYRKKNHLTQLEFCEVLGRAQSTISAYENNHLFPEKPEELKFIAGMLGISIREIINAIEYGRHGYVVEDPYTSLLIDLEEMENEGLRKKYKFVYKDKEISDEEYKKILKLLEFERFDPNR